MGGDATQTAPKWPSVPRRSAKPRAAPAQWTALLAQAKAAEGALQVQQVTMQAQGVIGHQLLAIEQQLATQAREQSMRALEEASRIELEQTRMERALQPLETHLYPARPVAARDTHREGIEWTV